MAVVDASVWVALSDSGDRAQPRCRAWLEAALASGEDLVAPTLFLVEVAGAIRRLTGEGALAARVVSDLLDSRIVKLVELTEERARRAAEIAVETGVRGADAVYLALAQELGDVLVTLDRQQRERGRPTAKTRSL